ncbi:hypothetical protein Q7P37_000670 [Cladosporium fusiforme]
MESDNPNHNIPPRRTMSAKRASMVRPLDVRRILQEQGASEAKPLPSLPAEHVASPPSPSASQHSAGSSGRTSFQSHGRTMSMASINSNSTPARTNRFSMQFPIQPATREQSPNRPSSSPSKDTTSAPAPVSGPSDSNFLTAIAAQERRVLELKEELQRAETELAKLKKSWANHEAYKKKNEARMLAKLEPVSSTPATPAGQDDEDGSSAWMQQEMERRKALLNGTRTSSRTVFSGSRHARTLSLLSPTRTAEAVSPLVQHPPRQDSLPMTVKQSTDSERPPLQHTISQSSITPSTSSTPDISNEIDRSADIEIDLAQANVDREVLIQQGKKIATDFKDGLWTFWEDLRQATVGDEATQVMPPNTRRQSSNQTLRLSYRDSSQASRASTASKASTETRKPTRSPVPRRPSPAHVPEEPPLIDTAGEFWSEHGLAVPSLSPAPAPAPVKKASKHAKKPSMAPSVASSVDAWDTWDDHSPNESISTSSTTSDSATHASTNATTPRHSAAISRDETLLQQGKGEPADGKEKEPLPWPALSKFRPTSLRRTASHLMSEWEKSMTPEPGQEFKGEESEFLPLQRAEQQLLPGEGERAEKRD